MKSLISLFLMLLFAFGRLAAQQASTASAMENSVSGSLEADLVSLTNEWTSAVLAKDRSRLDTLMAPDFTLDGWDGSWHVERARWFENLFKSINIAEYRHSAIVPHIYGDVAAVTSKWYWRGTRGQNEKKPFEEHGYVVDVWRHADGHWQVVSRISVIVPGKEEPSASAAPTKAP